MIITKKTLYIKYITFSQAKNMPINETCTAIGWNSVTSKFQSNRNLTSCKVKESFRFDDENNYEYEI